MALDLEKAVQDGMKEALAKSFAEQLGGGYKDTAFKTAIDSVVKEFIPEVQTLVRNSIRKALDSGEFKATIEKALHEKLVAAALQQILGTK